MFNITGEDIETQEEVFYEETDDFMYEEKSTTILIEANQDSYRAGEMSKFYISERKVMMLWYPSFLIRPGMSICFLLLYI